MTIDQLRHARDLIRQKKIDEARHLLRTIDHPTARQWLARLNQVKSAPHAEEAAASAPAKPEPPAAQAAASPPPAGDAAGDLDAIKQRLLRARTLIKQRQFEAARALLQTIDHPTAAQWLEKLNANVPPTKSSVAPPAPAAPAPPADEAAGEAVAAATGDPGGAISTEPPVSAPVAGVVTLDHAPEAPVPPPAEAERVAAAMSDTERLRLAQEALLNDQYDEARAMLEPLSSQEAAFWLEKTGMTRFRSYENIWLDLFHYSVPLDPGVDPDTWRCTLCGLNRTQALSCPRRGQLPCPVQFNERTIREPRRLALLLQALYLGQGQDLEKILGHIDASLLEDWKRELEWQLAHMGQVDVRRPVVTAAIPLLGQYVEAQRSIERSRPARPRTTSPAADRAMVDRAPEAAPAAPPAPDQAAAASDTGAPPDASVVRRILEFLRRQVIN